MKKKVKIICGLLFWLVLAFPAAAFADGEVSQTMAKPPVAASVKAPAVVVAPAPTVASAPAPAVVPVVAPAVVPVVAPAKVIAPAVAPAITPAPVAALPIKSSVPVTVTTTAPVTVSTTAPITVNTTAPVVSPAASSGLAPAPITSFNQSSAISPYSAPASSAALPTAFGGSLNDPELLPSDGQRIRGAADWESLARSIAHRVQDTIAVRPDLQNMPIFVQEPKAMPFEHVFHEFLRTALVSRGLQVVHLGQSNALVLEYDALLVRPVNQNNVSFFDMGVDQTPSRRDNAPREVLINARLVFSNRFAMHLSALRIIENEEWVLYLAQSGDAGSLRGARRVRVLTK